MNVKSFIEHNAAEILGGLGCVFFVGGAVKCVFDTKTALELIDIRKKELGVDKLDFKETVKTAWKAYIPTAGLEVAGVACVVSSLTKSHKDAAALSSVYALSETAFKDYRDQVVKSIGEKKEKEIRDTVAQQKVLTNPPKDIIMTGNGDQLCKDSFTGRYFESSVEKIQQAINELNDELLNGVDGSVTINDFYYRIGLEDVKNGDDIGWDYGLYGLIKVDFDATLTPDKRPCLVVDFDKNRPRYL